MSDLSDLDGNGVLYIPKNTNTTSFEDSTPSGNSYVMIKPEQWEFTPQDDMTPLEAVYTCLALQSLNGYPLSKMTGWDLIKRHFTQRS